MPKKEDGNKNVNVTGQSGLNGKTITGVTLWRHGIVDVIEISYSGGTTYIKVRQGQYDLGGTADWATGTIF